MSAQGLFKRVTVTSTSFADSKHPDVYAQFESSGLMLYLESETAVVEVSFDGVNVQDELNPAFATRGLVYDNRSTSVIWFRLKSGTTADVSVRIW